uniref:Na_Ca_ex domain-containing protein n=1 Tax=Heterorhabditis bacteriophora TaxID=37862 RepID=A0A1I7W6Q7_HETBA
MMSCSKKINIISYHLSDYLTNFNIGGITLGCLILRVSLLMMVKVWNSCSLWEVELIHHERNSLADEADIVDNMIIERLHEDRMMLMMMILLDPHSAVEAGERCLVPLLSLGPLVFGFSVDYVCRPFCQEEFILALMAFIVTSGTAEIGLISLSAVASANNSFATAASHVFGREINSSNAHSFCIEGLKILLANKAADSPTLYLHVLSD